MQVQPYLSFEGRAEEALDFYAKAIGAKVGVKMRFKEAPPMEMSGNGCADMGAPPAHSAEKIMHSEFKVGDSLIMATDGMCSGNTNFTGISLALQAKDDAEAKKIFDALSQGGKVQQPLIKTFFASSFGMVADKFGVGWMVVTAQA
ncbi:VOC family protein [Nordella sp. HKS 07]|uniref:VOC family protein n=1 Tax=Nordella sp. HKS 07 TaxID=2712222 RepID=UPI0013E17CB6|nr:VOC family protein [Nordella sp. HKS 07]QIG47311.1 VOC family protein [Nordella sp. HKS 07]